MAHKCSQRQALNLFSKKPKEITHADWFKTVFI